MKKKRAFTLLEIIIVIFLITLITGAVGYNMKGALDRGRAFRTEQAKEQLYNLLVLCLEEGESMDTLVSNPESCLRKYNLAKNPQKLVQDGWGNHFEIQMNRRRKEFTINSRSLNEYNQKMKKT